MYIVGKKSEHRKGMQSNEKKNQNVYEKFNNKATRDITLITAHKRIKQKIIITKKSRTKIMLAINTVKYYCFHTFEKYCFIKKKKIHLKKKLNIQFTITASQIQWLPKMKNSMV